MALYETVFIARQDLSSAQADALTKRFIDIAKENGATLDRNEYWGLRPLAYEIKKNRKGHYTLLHLTCDPSALKEMERHMYLSEDILRYQTIRVEEFDKDPSPIMRAAERDDRRSSSHESFERHGEDKADSQADSE